MTDGSSASTTATRTTSGRVRSGLEVAGVFLIGVLLHGAMWVVDRIQAAAERRRAPARTEVPAGKALDAA